MTKGRALELKGLAAGCEKARALAGSDFANVSDRDIGGFSAGEETGDFVGRNRA
jgi:hypothetical protein